MKRHFDDEITTNTCSPLIKIAKLDDHSYFPQPPPETFLSNDVLSVIFSFLPFYQLFTCTKLVSHQWNTSVQSEFRCSMIQSIGNYLSCQFEADSDRESMTRLFVCVKHWIGSRQCTLNLLPQHHGLGNAKKEQYMMELHTRNEYPNIRIKKYESNTYEDYVIMEINFQSNVSLKMSILYSNAEDYFIHVEPNEIGGNFDWNANLNIDPNVKRNLVFSLQNQDDMDIGNYEINEKFFNSLFKLLGIDLVQKEPPTPFNTLLWRLDSDPRYLNGIGIPIENIEFKESFEISDDRLNQLIDKFNYLESINEYKVLQLMEEEASRSFTTITEKQRFQTQIANASDSHISVSNVVGYFYTLDLTGPKPRRFIDSSFDLLYKGNSFRVSFKIYENFFYGHDGSESECEFICSSKTSDFTIDFSPYVNICFSPTENSLVYWNNPVIPALEDATFNKPYSFRDYLPEMRQILLQWLNIVPRYHLLSYNRNSNGDGDDGGCKLFIENDGSIEFLVDGRYAAAEATERDDDNDNNYNESFDC